MMKWSQHWIIFALGSAFFASLTALFGKMGTASINSNLATLIRTMVVLLMTSILVSSRQEWQQPGSITPRTWMFLILSGIATGLSWLCYYRALQLGPVAKVASIDKTSVILTIILGVLILKEKLTWTVLLGGGLITLGAIVLVFH